MTDKADAQCSASDVLDKVEVQSSPSDVTAQSSVGGKKSVTASVGATVNRQLRSKKSKFFQQSSHLVEYIHIVDMIV